MTRIIILAFLVFGFLSQAEDSKVDTPFDIERVHVAGNLEFLSFTRKDGSYITPHVLPLKVVEALSKTKVIHAWSNVQIFDGTKNGPSEEIVGQIYSCAVAEDDVFCWNFEGGFIDLPDEFKFDLQRLYLKNRKLPVNECYVNDANIFKCWVFDSRVHRLRKASENDFSHIAARSVHKSRYNSSDEIPEYRGKLPQIPPGEHVTDFILVDYFDNSIATIWKSVVLLSNGSLVILGDHAYDGPRNFVIPNTGLKNISTPYSMPHPSNESLCFWDTFRKTYCISTAIGSIPKMRPHLTLPMGTSNLRFLGSSNQFDRSYFCYLAGMDLKCFYSSLNFEDRLNSIELPDYLTKNKFISLTSTQGKLDGNYKKFKRYLVAQSQKRFHVWRIGDISDRDTYSEPNQNPKKNFPINPLFINEITFFSPFFLNLHWRGALEAEFKGSRPIDINKLRVILGSKAQMVVCTGDDRISKYHKKLRSKPKSSLVDSRGVGFEYIYLAKAGAQEFPYIFNPRDPGKNVSWSDILLDDSPFDYLVNEHYQEYMKDFSNLYPKFKEAIEEIIKVYRINAIMTSKNVYSFLNSLHLIRTEIELRYNDQANKPIFQRKIYFLEEDGSESLSTKDFCTIL